MTPYFADESATLWHGDALEVLRQLPAGSVDCCVTSPPYFGLRDYGETGQFGLESSPAEYVETMRGVFAEVRRVLADDGTLWLNLGDSYSSATKGSGGTGKSGLMRDGRKEETRVITADRSNGSAKYAPRRFDMDVPAKNLLGIPWRVAFALQDDGWILRNDIIWAKPNAMPMSVQDRLNTVHEHLFLLAKSRRYWFDLDPIRDAPRLTEADVAAKRRSGPAAPNRLAEENGFTRAGRSRPISEVMGSFDEIKGRNPGDVWTVPTQPFAAAHFAVMPQHLAERAILAGCPARRCRTCGHAPEPTKARGGMDMSRPQAKRAMEIAEANGLTDAHFDAIRSAGATDAGKAAVTQSGTGKNTPEVAELAAHAKSVLKGYYREFLLDRLVTDGWTDCGHGDYAAGTVLDPFSGSGTTGLAAAKHGRRYVGIDLSADYLDLSLRTRLAQPGLDFGEASA